MIDKFEKFMSGKGGFFILMVIIFLSGVIL